MHKGSCLCGAITIDISGDVPDPIACHCTKCRKWNGHFGVGAEVKRTALTIHGEDSLSWFVSSDKARRGFCKTCGTSLFFDPLDTVKNDWIGVLMGAFDGPTRSKLALHIYAAEKGDYYEITDGVPQNEY